MLQVSPDGCTTLRCRLSSQAVTKALEHSDLGGEIIVLNMPPNENLVLSAARENRVFRHPRWWGRYGGLVIFLLLKPWAAHSTR